MADQPVGQLEAALARTEADAELALKAAGRVIACLRRLRTAAHDGKFRELEAARETAGQLAQVLASEVSAAVDGWQFDEVGYLADGFVDELMSAAAGGDLQLFQQDGLLYCYPALLRVLPADRAISVDKTRERRLRPGVLLGVLRDMQKRPPRFKPADFLEALGRAYRVAVAQQPARSGGTPVVPLLDLHALLTMLPGQEREYSRQEFARDVYLLDQSGVTETKQMERIEFHASTGTRGGRTLSVVTQGGGEQKYYGVSFSPAGSA